MSQRKSLPADQEPAAVNDTPIQNHAEKPEDTGITKLYKESNDHDRLMYLTIITKQWRDYLYQHYLEELEGEVTRLEEAQHPVSAKARELYLELKRLREDKHFIMSDVQLFNAVHKSIALLRTPVINAEERAFNPDFETRANEFTYAMNDVKAQGNAYLALGLTKAICGGLIVVGAAALMVLTFGFPALGLDKLMSGVMAACNVFMGGILGVSSIPNFAFARRQNSLFKAMDSVVSELKNENEEANWPRL